MELDKLRTMKELKKLSDEEKLMYLEFLKEKYHPSLRMLAEMLECSANTVSLLAKDIGFDSGYKQGTQPNKAYKRAWMAFCGGSPNAEEPVKEPAKSEEKAQGYGCEGASVWVYATPQEVSQLLLMLSGERRRRFHISFSEVEE